MSLYESMFKLGSYFCHQKPERSFFINNYQFPCCARCTGLFLGVFLGLLFSPFLYFDKFYLMIFFLIPIFIDGLTQKYSNYESNNRRRIITGIMFGFSYIYLVFMLEMIY